MRKYFSIFFIQVFIICIIITPNKTLAGYYDYSDVVLVINDSSATSTTIGNYFAAARGIASSSIIHITASTNEWITRSEFTNNIRIPIQNFLNINGKATSTNYIVTTKGVPLAISDTTKSVESELGLILGPYANSIGNSSSMPNPYYYNYSRKYDDNYYRSTQFSRAVYGIYLTTRLDGYTIQDVKNLIDRSANSTTTDNGTFVLDVDPGRDGGAYQTWNEKLRTAAPLLVAKGYTVLLDQTTLFLNHIANVIGYSSWGSNDGNFSTYTTNAIPVNTYKNGAIAETAVSTDGRSFELGAVYGQSLIADLIAEGVSGVKGYVSEPYLNAIALPNILYNKYTDGYNMAESFYGASKLINWKDVVIGDPKMVIVKNKVLPFTLNGPKANVIITSTTPTFSWNEASSYNGIAKYQLFIDGILNTDNIIGTSTTPNTALTPGSHTWSVKAIDNLGNWFLATNPTLPTGLSLQEIDNIPTTTPVYINIIPTYSSSTTFYVDNILGNDNNPGSISQPWATLNKAQKTVQGGDTVIIIKNIGNPYHETIKLPSLSYSTTSPITFKGTDENHKPEIWGSDDISSGWTLATGTNPNTYRRVFSTADPHYLVSQAMPTNFYSGTNVNTITKRNNGGGYSTLAEGQWGWTNSSPYYYIYYRLTSEENINTFHAESTYRNLGIDATLNPNSIFQNLIIKYTQTGIGMSSSTIIRSIESYYNSYGAQITSASKIYNSIFSNNIIGIYIGGDDGLAENNTLSNNDTNVYIENINNITFRNNIISGTTTPFGFVISDPEDDPADMVDYSIKIFNASNNNWTVLADSVWNYLKGSFNREALPSLFTDETNRNYNLNYLSGNIDNGTSSILIVDGNGNPIYGIRDIGAYEYQPPHSISTDGVDIGGGARIYSDGKFRDLSTTTNLVAGLSISPVGGYGIYTTTTPRTSYMDIAINSWTISPVTNLAWNESSSIATNTVHSISGLTGDHYYDVSIDSSLATSTITGSNCTLGVCKADSSGNISFTYTGGYSSHNFSVVENFSLTTPTPTTSGGGGGGGGSSYSYILPVSTSIISTSSTSTGNFTSTTSSTSKPSTIINMITNTTGKLSNKTCSYIFNYDMKPGSIKADVIRLQKFLNMYTETTVAKVGAGSIGYETPYFGPATVKAVKKLQSIYLKELGITTPTGNVFNGTRGIINSLCK